MVAHMTSAWRGSLARLRYGVGAGARWIPFARVLLPQRAFDYLLRRGFGLPTTRRAR